MLPWIATITFLNENKFFDFPEKILSTFWLSTKIISIFDKNYTMPIIAKSLNPLPKTVELIIYISSRLKDKLNYGSTLLGKSLYLIDSMSYLKTGKPLTDLTYIKQERGPTPEPSKFLSIRDSLIANGDLAKINADYFGRMQVKFIAKREPKIDVFEKDEIVLINDVIESISDRNASEISDYTHQFIAWIFSNHKEELPFYTFLLTHSEPELKDYKWANRSIKAYQSEKNNAS
jgi:hypothetical protein